MRISDWSSDVCSSDLRLHRRAVTASQDDAAAEVPLVREIHRRVAQGMAAALGVGGLPRRAASLEVGELAGSIVGAHQDLAAIAPAVAPRPVVDPRPPHRPAAPPTTRDRLLWEEWVTTGQHPGA